MAWINSGVIADSGGRIQFRQIQYKVGFGIFIVEDIADFLLQKHADAGDENPENDGEDQGSKSDDGISFTPISVSRSVLDSLTFSGSVII